MKLARPSLSPVLFLSDLPAWGRVAMALGIPLLEARGIQTCSLPTALLSTHGAYAGAVLAPQTEFLRKALDHLGSLRLEFSAVYSGFVAEQAQFGLISGVLSAQRKRGAVILVDPILGDNGRLYGLFAPEAVPAMRDLVSRAHLVTPNITEAALLLGHPADQRPRDQEELEGWMARLSALGPRFVALTSAPVFGKARGRDGAGKDAPADGRDASTDDILPEDRLQAANGKGRRLADSIAVVLGDGKTGRITVLSHQKTEPGFPGTGDYFASVLLAEILLRQAGRRGKSGAVPEPALLPDASESLDPAWVLAAARKATRLVRRRLAWSRLRVKDPRQGLARL